MTATNKITMGGSNLDGFEIGIDTIGAIGPAQSFLNKMAGVLTSEVTDLEVNEVDNVYFYNNRITASSVVMVTANDPSGVCLPVVFKTVVTTGSADLQVKNIGSSDCTNAYKMNFVIIS